MDFMNRGVRTNQPAGHQSDSSTGNPNGSNQKTRFGKGNMSWSKIGNVGFLVAIVVLVSAALLSLVFAKGLNESQYVDKSKYQAVFLNGGQVYFGKISDLNKQFMKVSDIYYLRVNQQVQPDANSAANQNDISLVKLGCELHGPQDNMVINREQVIFWENLKDDGQVAKAVAEYVKQNPDGQKCDAAAASPSSSNGNSNTNTNTNTGTTNNTSTTPTTAPKPTTNTTR